MAIVGIDLGTSNSAVSLRLAGRPVEDGINPFVVAPAEGTYKGANVVPSYMAFTADGKVQAVGKYAKASYDNGETGTYVRNLKRLIGRSYDHVEGQIQRGARGFLEFKGQIRRGPQGQVEVLIGGSFRAVEWVASFLVRKLVEDASAEARRKGESIDAVTISIPAGFEGAQREATLAAGRLAGLGIDVIQVIEEPTAAALAKQVDGTVLVVDIGAGTTDIVVGSLDRTGGPRPDLVMANRTCDDELGGIDMDNLLFAHAVERQPILGEVFEQIDASKRREIMGVVEKAKIGASLDGSASVTKILKVGDRAVRINIHIPEETLDQVVRPLVHGYRDGDQLKGVKPLVLRTLLDLAYIDTEPILQALRQHRTITNVLDDTVLRSAGYDPAHVRTKVTQVIRDIDHLVLVGGPCRMRCVHRMLADVFAQNPRVLDEINSIDPLDCFFMEAVSRGAAMPAEVETVVPHNVSMFHWQTGQKAVVIPKGTPYRRGETVLGKAALRVGQGGQWVNLVTEKTDSRSAWSYGNYQITVPQPGSVSVALSWREQGTDTKQASIDGSGAGMPAHVSFPSLMDTRTLGVEVSSAFRGYLEAASRLRQLLPEIQQKSDSSVSSIEVSEADLAKCDGLDLDALSPATDEDLVVVLADGYFAARRQLESTRWGLSPEVRRALDVWFSLDRSFSAPELIEQAELVLRRAAESKKGAEYAQSLRLTVDRFRKSQTDAALAAETATALSALAECLHALKPPALDDRAYDVAMHVAFHIEVG